MKIFSTAYAPTSRRSGAIEPYKLAGSLRSSTENGHTPQRLRGEGF